MIPIGYSNKRLLDKRISVQVLMQIISEVQERWPHLSGKDQVAAVRRCLYIKSIETMLQHGGTP